MTKTLEITGVNKILNPIYKKYLWGNKHLTQIYFGGSSSGKSFAIAQRAVIDVLNGRNYLVVRKTGASIAKSSFNEIREKIYQFKLQSFFRINASAFTITCTLNNCQFIFTGLDDVEKVKSIRPLTGVITDIWIEEATEISVNDYRQLTKRLRGVSRFPKRITMSFNPILKTHWIYKEFFATLWRDDQQYVEDKTTSILKTTYKDNVHLMPDDIERLESETDPYYRDVYLLGNWGTLAGVIYNNWRVEDFDKESFAEYRMGLDWGFASDEFAFVRIAIDTKRKIIHVCDEIYQTELLNDKAIQLVKPIARGGIVWCDSAEPKSIAEFRANGINARPVKKGSGSIEQGINFLKRFQIIVHPFCVNTIKELSTYHYKTDRATGEPLPVPADVDNHICVAKGTLITTKNGDVLIENLKVDDLVLTRMGYKKVVDQALTAHNANVVTLKTTKGELQLTKNHKVFCVNKACFVPADALRYGDDILFLEDSLCKQKKFIITAKNTIAILIQVILTTGIISSVAGSIYIIKCGKIIMENAKRASIFIIKTIIPQTTALKILNKYQLRSTHQNIGQKSEARSKKSLWMKLDRLQVNGTSQKQEVNGINNTQKTSILDTFNMGKQSVLFAKLNLLKHKIFRFFVLINAKQKIEEIAEQITSQGFVPTVKKNFKLINIQKQKLVPDTVVSVIDGNKKSDVYNITVEDAHEFLANGILVKNCDALRYATEYDALMRGSVKDVL